MTSSVMARTANAASSVRNRGTRRPGQARTILASSFSRATAHAQAWWLAAGGQGIRRSWPGRVYLQEAGRATLRVDGAVVHRLGEDRGDKEFARIARAN